MSNTGSNYRGTLHSDGKLSIKSNMNDCHLRSDNVCTKMDVLLDLINIREGNISCHGFTREEINFMIYDICVHRNCILKESARFLIHFYMFICTCFYICTMFNNMHIFHAMYLYA